MRLPVIAAALMLAVSSAAQAAPVRYVFVYEGGGNTEGATGSILFSEAGPSSDYYLYRMGGFGNVLEFSFTILGAPGAGLSIDFRVDDPYRFPELILFDHNFLVGGPRLQGGFELVTEGFEAMRGSGEGNDWLIRYGLENIICGGSEGAEDPACFVTGYWRRAGIGQVVSEPGQLALLGLGIGAAVLVRRRRRPSGAA